MEHLDDELICPICRDIFSEPVTLLCGHNLCYGCVSELKKSARSVTIDHGRGLVEQIASRTFTCPLCLAPCDIKMDLQKNIVLTNIIAKYHTMHSTNVYCSLCKEEKRSAEKSCVNCNGSFCAIHIVPHYRDVTLLEHTLVNPINDTSKLCKEHGKEFELFCETDYTPLCAYCMLPAEAKHKDGHSVVKLSETKVTLKESLLRQKNEHVAFLQRVKIFVDEEAKAWNKKFSLDMEKLAYYEDYVWMRELEDGDLLNDADRPFGVLSKEAFSPGGHYWEVEVEGLTSWALGVAQVISSSEQAFLRQRLGSDQASWALSYSASRQQMSVRHHTLVYSFPANDGEPPGRVGLFLDVAGGILMFYDAATQEPIYTFYFRTALQGDGDSALLAAFCPRLREDDQPLSTRPMRLLTSFPRP
ncbi:zinc-binding protein A33-like [Aplochiton taeniatus]